MKCSNVLTAKRLPTNDVMPLATSVNDSSEASSLKMSKVSINESILLVAVACTFLESSLGALVMEASVLVTIPMSSMERGVIVLTASSI